MSMQSTLRTVADSKHEGIQSVSPDDLVIDAVEKMQSRNIGAMVVLNGDGRVAGIFSERDLLTRVVGKGLDPGTTRVAEVMTPDPQSVEASMTVEQAMQVVTEQHVRHLPLMTGDRLEGLISSGDLMAWALTAQKVEIQGLSRKLGTSMTKNKALIALIVGFSILIVIAILAT